MNNGKISTSVVSFAALNEQAMCKFAVTAFCGLAILLPLEAKAAANTFQVGTTTIHNTAQNPFFDTVNLAPDFAETPAIFTLTSTRGFNSCEIRMQNVGTNSFEAVCAEDSSWDGEHADVPLQFAAITEGVKTIPTNNGGSVTFEVGCVTTNAVQHNCTTGCDVESYEPITFSAGFTNPPVVLANIQTVENLTAGTLPTNPAVPMLSVAVDNIVSGGFDLALDLNKEDDVGSLNDEKICWLAVEETSRCDLNGTDDTLNFSSIGGPASVAFEAIITPDNIDGWDNGCNNTEEATFTPGCFTSTPVAIATKRGRQEPEGWLRYCTLNSGELRLTVDEQRVTGADPQDRMHVDETASVIAFGSSFTTPVTLARFASKASGNRHIVFEWETESESFNIGFNLWAEVSGEWVQLNRRIVASDTNGLADARTYKRRIKLNKDTLENATAFGLSSYDNAGYEEFFGPFALGEEYGQGTEFKPIDWSEVRAKYSARMRASGYVELNGRWKRSSEKRAAIYNKREYQLGRELVSLSTASEGIHKISYADVMATGVSWQELPISSIALTQNGDAVPRLMVSDNQVFDAGDEIIFYAPPLAKEDALYTQESVYRIQRDASKAVDASRVGGAVDPDTIASSSYQARYLLEQNNIYVATSTNGDPWVDRKIFAYGSSASTQYDFEVLQPNVNVPAQVKVNLVGGIDFPSVASENPDHHVVVNVNGLAVADVRFDGFKDHTIVATVPASALNVGSNAVTIILPGDTGQLADIVYVDSVSLSVQHASQLGTDSLTIPADAGVEVYEVAVSSSADNTSVFAYQLNGSLAVLEAVDVTEDTIKFAAMTGVAAEDTVYAVMPEGAYLAPANVSLEQPFDLVADLQADYLIVAHPSFINADLERFAQAKQERGLSTKIVNWLDIVDSYGYGMPTPDALRNFLKSADAKHNFDYVLIVGGHSYDYNDHLQLGNVNFIPTMYQTVRKNFVYAPTDALLVDMNDDGLPNKAVGRWPVRTESDLRNIVNKTLRWESDAHLYSDNTLFLADVTDSARAQNFGEQLDQLAMSARLGAAVSKIYLDDYLANDTDTPIEDARADLFSEFEESASGVGLTVFNGHSSSSRWTFRNLFSAQDAASLENAESPTFVMPLACYTTLYEAPSVNTLAHQLLFESEAGAVALSGASYLSEYRENAEFAKRLLNGFKKTNATVGQAILKEKSKMMPWNDTVTNWSLLGDPSIKLSSTPSN